MRAHTIISIIVLGALAIPASAVANNGYATPNAITGGSDDSSQPQGAPDYSSVNSISGSTDVSSQTAPSSDYSSLNSISGSPSDTPTFVSGAPSAGDQFDWGDAALGAGVALALAAFGGAALLSVRRRTAMSPVQTS
jgi:hypothetical protein